MVSADSNTWAQAFACACSIVYLSVVAVWSSMLFLHSIGVLFMDIAFISSCAGLFNHIFSVVYDLPVFNLLIGYIVFYIGFAVLLMLIKGTRRM